MRAKKNAKSPAREAKGEAKAPGAATTTVVVMRLYIAGSAPNSLKAIANLEAICERYLKDSYKLEVVDVFEHPQRALADGVLVTPSLTKVSPRPGAQIIGNLSDKRSVLLALGLKKRERELELNDT